jgi:hypothetical protein
MMAQIASTPFYSINADTGKNRIYYTITGTWKSPSDVPNYLEDIKKAVRQVKSGFTILTDLTHAKTAMPEIKKLHEQAQSILISAGLSKVAEVFPEKDYILKMQVDKIAQATKMVKKEFINKKEAEEWLDKVQK